MAGSGISWQSSVAIKRLDAGEEGGKRAGIWRSEPISPTLTQYANQGVTARRPMTDAQRAQMQALINRRPDAAAFRPLTRPKR